MSNITFAKNPLDKSSKLRSDLDWQNKSITSEKSKFMIFFEDKPLINVDPKNMISLKIFWASYQEISYLLSNNTLVLFLGIIDDNIYYALDLSISENQKISSDNNFQNSKFIDVRSIVPNLNNNSTGVIAQAKSNFDWNKKNIYCSKCKDQELVTKDSGYKKICKVCNTEYFPRVDPVVIMLPFYKDKCLLGRQNIFPPDMYSALAGFIEPGETIEDAVCREGYEEVGLKSNNVVYHFSQPWPFPSQLMIGCMVETDNDDHKIDNDEIEDAVWIDKEELTSIINGKHKNRIWIPPPMAIAHHLILEWMEKS